MKTLTAPNRLREQRLDGRAKDPFAIDRKLPGPAVCSRCGALYLRGRWRWSDSAPLVSRKTLCQACRRVREGYAAGWVSLKGGYVAAHRGEIVGIILRSGRRESADHPLNRIMDIKEQAGGLLVTTTDIHLPRLIGEALRRAHQGKLRLAYDKGGYAVRVDWTREAA